MLVKVHELDFSRPNTINSATAYLAVNYQDPSLYSHVNVMTAIEQSVNLLQVNWTMHILSQLMSWG